MVMEEEVREGWVFGLCAAGWHRYVVGASGVTGLQDWLCWSKSVHSCLVICVSVISARGGEDNSSRERVLTLLSVQYEYMRFLYV